MVSQEKKQTFPTHLKPYMVEQSYQSYTSRDHALWRFIMRNAADFLSVKAHSSYLKGLELTGIPIDRIPKITEMDEKLSKFGWRAVCVRGFIPPLAFLEFQSNKILPIAADMRSVEHFDYTPAPDIVHEAAGHAPILADAGYREYLSRYAWVARRAIFSNQDVRLYEAIRLLSDVKENPDSTKEAIQKAEDGLKVAYEAVTWVSEAAKVTRMYWWTVEYGLIGSVQDPKIYGAGLLSSLAEGKDCFQSHVEKVPFSMKCVSTSYDITEPQPQLFVAKDFSQLTEALKALEETMAFKKGGVESLELAKKAESVTTTQLDSDLEISGILEKIQVEKGQPVFLKWKGPVQLATHGQQIENQGCAQHPEGFSTPLGKWKGLSKHPSDLSDGELKALGFFKNDKFELNYESGFKVQGFLKGWTRNKQGKLLLLHCKDCSVSQGSQVYYEPAWGDFDLAVGVSVPSVYGGPADWMQFGSGDFGRASTQPGRTSPFTEKEKKLFALYDSVRKLRSSKDGVLKKLEELCVEVRAHHKKEWLLALELKEIFHTLGLKHTPEWFEKMEDEVLDLRNYSETQSRFIKMGLELAEKSKSS